MGLGQAYVGNRFVQLDQINPAWYSLLASPVVAHELNLADLSTRANGPSTPDDADVLRFMRLDPREVNIIILGQDPYKPAGVANGRAFQPANLESWTQPFRQVSLKNILRAIWAVYNLRGRVEPESYDLVVPWKVLSSYIETGKFKVAEPPAWFDSLERQGVLFLNSSLTTRVGVSGAHVSFWSGFVQDVMKFMHRSNPYLAVFAWGNAAQDVVANSIPNAITFESRHPMMCSKTYQDDFLYNPCFLWAAQGLGIDWTGTVR